MSKLLQTDLPPQYQGQGLDDLQRRVAARKAQLGRSLVILGHHYQSDEVVQFADFVGDSLRLSQLAAGQTAARYIVFCGVHFMAESADILSSPDQIVCLPNLFAGCSMAQMADAGDVQEALASLGRAAPGAKIVPVAYVNSTAAVKAVTGRGGGACCTSGNVANVFRWALSPSAKGGGGAGKVLALPDQHLARNTTAALGATPGQCVLYDPHAAAGGLSADDIKRARFVVWKGHCYVHQTFRPQHVAAVRRQHPGITVIVHPECPAEVVALADQVGSTEQIIQAIAAAGPGSRWAVGTESALVHRLQRQHPDRLIRVLSDNPSYCAQMKRVDLPHLLWVLDNLADGNVVNRVSVPDDIAVGARIALKRMIEIPRQ